MNLFQTYYVGKNRKLTGVAPDLSDNVRCSEIIDHIALVNAYRGNNIASGVHSQRSSFACMEVKTRNLGSILEHLDNSLGRRDNRLVASPDSIGDRTIRLERLNDLFLG